MSDAQSTDVALIDPLLVWGGEDEDEWGNPLPGTLVLDPLMAVEYDGEHWVTSFFSKQLMLRRDVLGAAADDVDLTHRPDAMWYAHGRPVAERPGQMFRQHHVDVLLRLGVKVLPLVPGPDHPPTHKGHGSLVHAVMRGEDWIGFVMARKHDETGVPLPDSLVCSEPRNPRGSGGAG